MQIIDYIYALVETETKRKFYIGRTIDPKRRIAEHRLGAKNYNPGDEDKYQYANCLDQLGVKWDMEIIMECGPETDGYEDFFINKFRDEPLQNMRAGDDEPWQGRDYRNPEEYLEEKKRVIEERNAPKPVKEKVHREADPDKMIFSFEKPNDKFMSPWMRERLQKSKK